MDSPPIIFLHVGQAGVRLGSSMWELFCLEHGIGWDGKFGRKSADHSVAGALFPGNVKLDTYFMEGVQGRHVPRAVFFDTDPTAVDEIRKGSKSRLFSSFQLITGKEDSSSNYARGYYSRGSENLAVAMDRIQNLVEASEKFQGFVLTRSIAGGTGSGFGSLLLRKLAEEFPKAMKFTVDVLPSPKLSEAAIEPYNTILASHTSVEVADVTFLVENQAVSDICSNKLGIKAPGKHNLNKLIALIMSSVTCSMHFQGTLNRTLSELTTNMVPYKRLHFPILSYSPLQPPGEESLTCAKFVTQALETSNQIVYSDAVREKNLAVNFHFKGELLPHEDTWIKENLMRDHSKCDTIFSSKLKLADWAPHSQHLKVGTCPVSPLFTNMGELLHNPVSLLVMKNTSSISNAWNRMTARFDGLFADKSYTHWFLDEGMLESEFEEAVENVKALAREYDEVGKGEDPFSRTASKAAITEDVAPKKNSKGEYVYY